MQICDLSGWQPATSLKVSQLFLYSKSNHTRVRDGWSGPVSDGVLCVNFKHHVFTLDHVNSGACAHVKIQE